MFSVCNFITYGEEAVESSSTIFVSTNYSQGFLLAPWGNLTYNHASNMIFTVEIQGQIDFSSFFKTDLRNL